jgi:flavin-dependent dehydrogenase
MKEIAIVGGGPSGSMCGQVLARAGFDVTLFEEHLAWEKPCGGGLTHKAIEAYPFLLSSSHPKKLIHSLELISSKGHRAVLDLEHPIVIYSRATLNALLLDRARDAGCRVIRTRITQVDASGPGARLLAGCTEYESDFVVLAAGARNSLLPGTRPLERGDLEMTLGYFVPALAESIRIKFLPRFEGYLWSFPRCDHLSVGICGSMARHTSAELRTHLHKFMSDAAIDTTVGRFYSHVLPSPQVQTLRARRVVGPNWALIGDAAAWVDPITGEGLYYALRSGDLLAQAVIAGCPAEYPARVRADFSGDLEFATRVARRFYRGKFLAGAVTTRMIQFVQRSATFRQLMADIFSGAQDYRSLKRRLWAQFGVTASEVISSMLKPRVALAHTSELLR